MRIAFVCNQVAGGWNPTDPQTWGGGEETVCLHAEELARRGHTVHVFFQGLPGPNGEPTGAAVGGVFFVPYNQAVPQTFDVAVYFKSPELAVMQLARRQFVWTDQERGMDPDPFERVVFCSQYLARVMAAVEPRLTPRADVIPYGVALDGLDGTADKDPDLVLHCSSPDRGLLQLLEAWPQVLAARPAARLEVAYGWELFDKCGGSRALKRQVMDRLAALGLTMQRRQGQELVDLYNRAGVFAYYCTGGEQYGLAVLKAQYALAVPVVRPWGALHDTLLGGLAVHSEHPPTSPQAVAEFATELVRALDPIEQATLRRELLAKHRASIQTVQAAADAWEALWARPAVVEPLTSHLRFVPMAPHFDNAPGWNFAAVVQAAVGQWLTTVQPKAPWFDPSLGFPQGPDTTPATADAVVVGWGLEDNPEPPEDHLRRLGIRHGTPVLLFTSTGMWRASKRHRVFDRRGLHELVGNMPAVQMQPAQMDQDGNGCLLTALQWQEAALGRRDLHRIACTMAPRETVSVNYIARNEASTIPQSLDSVAQLADEVVVAVNGCTDDTAAIARAWGEAHRIPVTIVEGTSPRWCFDCQREHDKGEMAYGHRLAGFETPRNQAFAASTMDWVLWVDCDEEVLLPPNFHKYLRPNIFKGYSVQQHHHSCDPPEMRKVDYPVRLVRRVVDPAQPVGWFAYGPLEWPTYGTGCTVRFSGVVHEHPGLVPDFISGVGPAIILADGHISHSGYFTEDARRRRFVRNWPLMVCDRQKYPDRRLTGFLWLRDLSHNMRYHIEQAGNRLVPEAAQLAEEAAQIYGDQFATTTDPYSADALEYGSAAYRVLSRGVECEVLVRIKKPEVTGEEAVVAQFAGRFDGTEALLKAIKGRLAEADSRWTGGYL